MSGPISQAVEAAKPAVVTPMGLIKQQLDLHHHVITRLLAGTGVSVETFTAQVANAVRAVPDLLACEPPYTLGAVLKAAQLGLAPNDSRNLCWILPYGKKAQFQMGYGGVMELARRATPGLKFQGHAVYPADEFDVDFGRDRPVIHKPAMARGHSRGGDAYAWYVIATFPDGSQQLGLLDREGVEYHRGFSKQPNGTMWSKSYDAAALKSVVTDMKRWLPSNPQITAAFAADETVIDVRNVDDLGELQHEPVGNPSVEVDGIDFSSGEITQGAA